MDGTGDAARNAQRRERRMWFVVVGATVLGGLGLPLVMWAAGIDRPPPGHGPLVVGLTAGLAVVTIVLALGFVAWRRRSGSALFARSPLWELPTRRERSRLVKMLRRGDPIPPEQHDLAARVARAALGRRGLIWLFVVAAVLMATGFALQSGHGWSRWLGLLEVLYVLAFVGYLIWFNRRMRRALARLESPPTPLGERPAGPP